jgi:hypothetical protein
MYRKFKRMKKLYILIAVICVTYKLSAQVSCNLSAAESCSASPQFSVGTGTIVNAYPDFPSVYGHWYRNTRHQLLFTASELSAAGVLPGNISSVSFIVNSFYTGYIGALPGLTISLKCVSQTSLANVFDNVGLAQVYSATSYTPIVGTNTHNFSNSYVWDGVSDLLVDICYTFYVNINYTNNPIMPSTTTSVTRCIYSNSDISSLCGIDTIPPTQTNKRPNIIFGTCASATSLNSKVKTLNNMDVFPNPSNGLFTISNTINTDKLEVTIINTLGQTVIVETAKNTNQLSFDLSKMSKGIYYAKVTNGDGSQLFKLILE